MDAVRFFLLSLAFFIIILHSFFEFSGLNEEVKKYYYFFSILSYILVIYGVFYGRGISWKQRISTYQGLSIVSICLLGGFLLLQNFYPSLS